MGGEGVENFMYCDVSDEENIKKCMDEIGEKYGRIDVLVNNAGYGLNGVLELIPMEKIEKQFAVNVYGVINCTRYALPYMRTYHPSYEKQGGVPAITEVQFSLTHNRGCFGGCNFCALAFHQGRSVRSRSIESVVEEARLLTTLPGFKGYINDVGGPTANFREPACEKQLKSGV